MNTQTPGTDVVPSLESQVPAQLSPATIVAAVKQRVQIVEEIQREIMQEGVHYGRIPGTQGKSLWQPGAEALTIGFNLAAEFEAEDLSHDGEHTYRVTCRLVDRNTGLVVGSAQAECTTLEEKWAWRKANEQEYEAAPADRKRIKHVQKKDRSGKPIAGQFWANQQVRQEPETMRDTVLAQAEKRAFVRAVRRTTGASHLFKEHDEKGGGSAQLVGPAMLYFMLRSAKQKGFSEDDVKQQLGADDLQKIPYSKAEEFCAWLSNQQVRQDDEPDTIDADADELEATDSDTAFDGITEAENRELFAS